MLQALWVLGFAGLGWGTAWVLRRAPNVFDLPVFDWSDEFVFLLLGIALLVLLVVFLARVSARFHEEAARRERSSNALCALFGVGLTEALGCLCAQLPERTLTACALAAGVTAALAVLWVTRRQQATLPALLLGGASPMLAAGLALLVLHGQRGG